MPAVTPLIVLLIGRGQPAILTVVALSAFFPMLINMTRGLRSADVGYHELLHSLAASRTQQSSHGRTARRRALFLRRAQNWSRVVVHHRQVGEWIGSNIGLGYLVVISGQYFKIPTLWAAVVVTSALTLLLVGIVAAIERLATPWVQAEAVS